MNKIQLTLTGTQLLQLLEGIQYCKSQAQEYIATIYPENIKSDAEHEQQLKDIDSLINVLSYPEVIAEESNVLREYNLSNSTSGYSLAKFEIEGIDGAYQGYTNGARWNGWEMPLFTKDVADKIMQEFNTETQPATYDELTDSYTFIHDLDDPDARFTVEGRDVLPVKSLKKVHVYGIGAGEWVWEEYLDCVESEE